MWGKFCFELNFCIVCSFERICDGWQDEFVNCESVLVGVAGDDEVGKLDDVVQL
jgi:hypothetical protein